MKQAAFNEEGKFGDEIGAQGIAFVRRRVTPEWLKSKTQELAYNVRMEANRPVSAIKKIVSSAPYEGLRRDYIRMCTGTKGGLVIVYDKQGTGKSYALQALARARLFPIQPSRFLVLNISGPTSFEELYEKIKLLVLGIVQDLDISPQQLAQVIRDGLCGPKATASTAASENSLPRTRNACRMDIDSQFVDTERRNDFPMLVIDEFVPTDFTWGDDDNYTLGELREKLGEPFEFFVSLTGLAYQEDGFAVFVGTKSEAFARALHKINGGSKASLAACTTIPQPRRVNDVYLFEDWRGLPWSRADKMKVAKSIFEQDVKKALHGQGFDEFEIDVKSDDIFTSVCQDDRNIREIMDMDVPDVLASENEKYRAILQAQGQPSTTMAGCIAGVQDVLSCLFPY